MRAFPRIARLAAMAALAFAAPAVVLAPPGTGVALAQPADKVVIENISVDTGFGVWRFPRLEAIGANVDAAGLRAVFSGDGPAHARIARLAAAALYAPTVEFELTFGNVRQTVIYRELHVEEIAGGRIGRVALGQGALTGAIEGEPFEATIGAMSATGVDAAGAAMLMTTGGTPDGRPVTLYETTSLAGYTARQPRATTEMGLSTARGVRMGPTAIPLNELGRRLTALRPDGKAPPDEAIALIADMFDAYRAIEVDEARVSKMKMTIEESGARIEATLADMVLSRFGNGALGLFSMGPMNISGKNGFEMRLGGMELAGYDLKPLIDTLKRIAADPALVETINPTAFAPLFDRFALSQLNVAAPSGEARGAPLDVAFDAFRIDRTGGATTRWSAALDRLSVSGGADDARLAALREAGFEAQRGSWRMAVDYKPAENAIEIADFTIEGAGAGVAALGARLGNVTEPIFTADRRIAALALLPVALKSAELRLADGGLIDKIVATRARKTKAAPAKARAAMVADLTRATKAFGAAAPARAFAKALVDFVKTPNAPLTVRFTADPGISALDAASVQPKSELWRKVKVEAVRR